MSGALTWLKLHRGTAVFVAIGALIVSVGSLALESQNAITAMGVGGGILVGIIIAIASSRNDKTPPDPRTKKPPK